MKPTGWFHLTLVFHGAGNGASVYYDGTLMDTDTSGFGSSLKTVSSGQMVLGRQKCDYDGKYATVNVDELTLWDN